MKSKYKSKIKYFTYMLTLACFCLNIACNSQKDTFELAFYDDARNTIWELHYKKQKAIEVNVINPQTNTKLNQLIIEGESKLDYNMSFEICKQKENIVLIGYGETPIFNVYNPISFEKIKDLDDLQKIESKIDGTIISMNDHSPDGIFFKDEIIAFTTTYPNREFYDVEKELFFNNEDELKSYITIMDEEQTQEQLITYMLFQDGTDSEVSQLFKMTSRDKRKAYYFFMQACSNVNTLSEFIKQQKRDCDKCQLTLLTDRKFTNTLIVYCDTSIVVLKTCDFTNSPDTETLFAYDANGMKLFEISQFDYPNLETRIKSNDLTHIITAYQHVPSKHQFVIYFGKFGAICINLKTGKLDWKYEPKVFYKPQESLRGK